MSVGDLFLVIPRYADESLGESGKLYRYGIIKSANPDHENNTIFNTNMNNM